MTGVFELEENLKNQLILLKKEFGLCAIKAEFEAEGSSFRDIIKLRRITLAHGVPLYLKIGGAEAIRDIKDALELGVDGLVAPMIESSFGLVKFLNACKLIYGNKKIFKSINIETCQAAEGIDDILKVASSNIDNITIGRTDLSRSYFDEQIQPDSEFIQGLIKSLVQKVSAAKLTLTVGGSLSRDSIECFRDGSKDWSRQITNLETRKVILPTNIMLGKEGALREAIKFEELYLRFKFGVEELMIKSDRERLAKLKDRL